MYTWYTSHCSIGPYSREWTPPLFTTTLPHCISVSTSTMNYSSYWTLCSELSSSINCSCLIMWEDTHCCQCKCIHSTSLLTFCPLLPQLLVQGLHSISWSSQELPDFLAQLRSLLLGDLLPSVNTLFSHTSAVCHIASSWASHHRLDMFQDTEQEDGGGKSRGETLQDLQHRHRLGDCHSESVQLLVWAWVLYIIISALHMKRLQFSAGSRMIKVGGSL